MPYCSTSIKSLTDFMVAYHAKSLEVCRIIVHSHAWELLKATDIVAANPSLSAEDVATAVEQGFIKLTTPAHCSGYVLTAEGRDALIFKLSLDLDVALKTPPMRRSINQAHRIQETIFATVRARRATK